jgi:glutamate synthase (NADPH/NADH) large chain
MGARLAGELALRNARGEGDVVDVTFNLTGTAGQSFGAFLTPGMKLVLTGQANDFVGKGLSGGEIVIRARGLAARESGHHVILGNVALYGATAGSNFGAGMTGGLAWVYDEDGTFMTRKRFHPEFIEPISFVDVGTEAQEELRKLIMKHAEHSESSLAMAMLADWSAKAGAFVMLSPKPQA